MNSLISEHKLFSKFLINSLKSIKFNQIECRLIHSKNCIQRNVIKNKPFLSVPNPNKVLKRDINFAKIRTFWRIILLKDRGVEHNFRKDRIDSKSNFLVYKAEVNRICTFGGILYPILIIFGCIGAKLWIILDQSPKNVDPHYKPSFFQKYLFETLLLVSLFHISLSRRYVLRIYFNKDKNVFTVTTWRWYYPFRTHKFDCKPGSAAESQWFGNNILLDTFFGNTKIGKRNVFINPEHFTFPVYYNVLFGFNPPEALDKFSLHSDPNHTEITEQMIKQRTKEISNNVSNF